MASCTLIQDRTRKECSLKKTALRWCVILILCQGIIFFLSHCSQKDQDAAPDFTVKSIGGEEIALSRLRGKTVFIDFWATWCGPCRESIPHLVHLYKTYHGKGFEIIGISVDKVDLDLVPRFAKSMDIPYPIAIAPTDLERQYGVTALPTGFLVDKNGKIVQKTVGFSPTIASQLDSKVAALTAQNP